MDFLEATMSDPTTKFDKEQYEKDMEKMQAANTRQLVSTVAGTVSYMLSKSLENAYGKMDRYDYDTLMSQMREIYRLRYCF